VAVGETVPHGVAGQVTVQVTPLLDESLLTRAVSCAVAPASTVVALAETETLTGGALAPPPHPKFPTTRTAALSIPISDT
jgi:hypothetical protein